MLWNAYVFNMQVTSVLCGPVIASDRPKERVILNSTASRGDL